MQHYSSFIFECIWIMLTMYMLVSKEWHTTIVFVMEYKNNSTQLDLLLLSQSSRMENTCCNIVTRRKYCCLCGNLWYFQHSCVGDTIIYHWDSDIFLLIDPLCILYNSFTDFCSNDVYHWFVWHGMPLICEMQPNSQGNGRSSIRSFDLWY